MFTAEWNTKSLDNFNKKMENLITGLVNSSKLGMEDALKNTQEHALKNKRGAKDKRLIPVEIVDFSKEKIIGRVHTDKNLFSFAPFLEFGTGIKADGTLPHIGKTKTFIASGYRYWLLPVDKVDRAFAPERMVNIGGELFYIMFATKPYPFMRPASFSSRKENVDLINESIGKMLMEVLK